jgi:hypothetical protein
MDLKIRDREDGPVQGTEDRDRFDSRRSLHARDQSAPDQGHPLLFEPNTSTLDMANQRTSRAWRRSKLLQVSPGSTVLLRGHVDNGMVEQFRQQGGEAHVRRAALRAMELSNAGPMK